MKRFSWLIRGGRVIDPATKLDAKRDIGIKGTRILTIAKRLAPRDAEHVYDASGKIVTPGLVDLHVHAYNLVTPFGIDVDRYCLGRGVTTAVDAGSAGSSTFPGFRTFICDNSQTRVLAFLNISCAGLVFGGLGGDRSAPGELDSMKLLDVGSCVDCVTANSDLLVGVKVRLSASCADNGENELPAYDFAKEAAAAVDLPLMVHHTFSTVSLEDCPGRMSEGQIYTHTYHGFPSTIIEVSKRRIYESVLSAREKGVIFDVGHGQGSFNWTVAEICVAESFWPDTISTDMHRGTCEGPAYDLPTVMTRFLHLGLPLYDVIERCTLRPAKAIGWDDRIGILKPGGQADVTVLSLEPVDMELEDCQSQMRHVRQRLRARAVWRAGKPGSVSRPACLPNPQTIAAQGKWASQLVIRDEQSSAARFSVDTTHSAKQK